MSFEPEPAEVSVWGLYEYGTDLLTAYRVLSTYDVGGELMYQWHFCRKCNGDTRHRHLHDSPYGLEGAHMAGTERYECEECGLTTYLTDGVPGFKFILDKHPSSDP